MAGEVIIQDDLFHGDRLADRTSFRLDRELMSWAFFGLHRTPSHRTKESRWTDSSGRECYIRVSPDENGRATIWDADILSYIQTQIWARMQRGEPVSPTVSISIYDCLKSIGRSTGGREYDLFLASIKRLKGTTVYTNITSNDVIEDAGFGWLQRYSLKRQASVSGKEKLISCEVTLCEWLFNATVIEHRYLSLDREYYSIESGFERKLYQICRRHLGNQSLWHVGADQLQEKMGSDSEKKKFLYELRQIVERDPFKDFSLGLTIDSRPPQFGKIVDIPQRNRKPVYLWVMQRRGGRRIGG